MNMKTESNQRRERNKNIIFCFAFICSLFNHSVFAETDTEDTVMANLVYFRPMIYIPEKAQLCQGVRVSKRGILTSPACQRKVIDVLEQSVPIEAMNSNSVSIGHIKASHNKATGFLFIEPEAGNSPYAPIKKEKSHYFILLGQDYMGNSKELEIHYLLLNDEGALAVKNYITADLLFRTDKATAQMATLGHLPDGAVAGLGKHVHCIISGNTCLRADSLIQLYQNINDPECQDIAQKSYHYDCGKNRIITSCNYAAGYDASGFYFMLGGTCINPKSRENCSFDSLYSGDDSGNLGIKDNVHCAKCSAQYLNTTIFNNPQKENKCTPSGCIGGCPGGNNEHENGSVASIAGGIVGGLALLSTIAIVTSYLIYKYRHRVNYQNL